MTDDAASQLPESTKENALENQLDFAKLTHQNWLFINAFLSSGNVQKAYALAKYEGSDASAPYQVFKRMKPYIEQIGDLDVTSRARLQADLKNVLAMPLNPDKTHLTLSEWLRVRKFAASMTPEATSQKPQISVLVINRPSQTTNDLSASLGENGLGKSGIGNNPASNSPNKDVIVDAEVLPPKS